MTGVELLKFSGLWLFANLMIGLAEEILFRSYFLYTLADGIGFWARRSSNRFSFGALHYYLKPHERWGRLGLCEPIDCLHHACLASYWEPRLSNRYACGLRFRFPLCFFRNEWGRVCRWTAVERRVPGLYAVDRRTAGA